MRSRLEPTPKRESGLVEVYVDITRLIERLHRRFLDVVRFELKRLGIDDINAVQALILTNVQDQEIAVRDLAEKGYYTGSNITYNLKQLLDGGYVIQERSPRDRRSVLIRLTDKGLALCQHLRELDDRLALAYSEGDGANVDIASARLALRQLERLWSDYIQYGRI
ncbi:MAG TPA: winged helix DNA-binding protein [Alphaproteobacteria bacterium]|jgi:DNA-binding MarR family transcriptional regulator|nr:winged helix DNA-binding protein [Alphaproteobacteria bacterium]